MGNGGRERNRRRPKIDKEGGNNHISDGGSRGKRGLKLNPS